MNIVTIRREPALSEAMERLRAEVLGCLLQPSLDAFDDRSIHVSAFSDGRPIGMVRVTPSTPSVLAAWAADEWKLPVGNDIAELTRGVVAPAWRRGGVYRLLMLEVMTGLRPDEVRMATAAVEPDFVGRRFLESLGFRAEGEPQVFRDAPRQATLAVPIWTEVDLGQNRRWTLMLSQLREELAAQGIAVAVEPNRDLPASEAATQDSKHPRQGSTTPFTRYCALTAVPPTICRVP